MPRNCQEFSLLLFLDLPSASSWLGMARFALSPLA
jgi:hypothetical protein